MPHPSTPETVPHTASALQTTPGLHPASTSDGSVPGATVVTEAATAEAALADVHDRLGPDARILDARRTLRGGIAGFFAREVVQLHAAPAERTGPAAASQPASAPHPASAPDPASAADPASAVDGAGKSPAGPIPGSRRSVAPGRITPIDRLLDGAAGAADDVDFATFLRRRLVPEAAPPPSSASATVPDAIASRVSHPGAPEVREAHWPPLQPRPDGMEGRKAHVVGAPSGVGDLHSEAANSRIEEPTAADDGGPGWSVTTLMRLGLPTELVRSLDVASPSDDLAWTHALATALRPLCRPLPHGDAVLVGPRAGGLARALAMPLTDMGGMPRTRGDVAVVVGAGDHGRAWLREVGELRWLHLVVGGGGWRSLLHADPLAVSWASPEDLPEALRCAVELGLVLGYGQTARGAMRARPLDVALAVRDLLPSR